MAKIKAGAIALVSVHIENRTEAGRFAVQLKFGSDVSLLEVGEARRLAEILCDAADKAEILDAAKPEQRKTLPWSAYESLTNDMTTIAARQVPRGVSTHEYARHALADAELREHDAPVCSDAVRSAP